PGEASAPGHRPGPAAPRPVRLTFPPITSRTEQSMNRDPVLFRVDGTVRTGWERLARCLTFAAALQRRRRPVYFLSQLEPGALGLNVKRAGNEWLDADSP